MSPNTRFRVIDSWSVYIVKNHIKLRFTGFRYFWIVQISKFLPVLLHFLRKVKKVENKENFEVCLWLFFPANYHCELPKWELLMPFRWVVSNVSIIPTMHVWYHWKGHVVICLFLDLTWLNLAWIQYANPTKVPVSSFNEILTNVKLM